MKREKMRKSKLFILFFVSVLAFNTAGISAQPVARTASESVRAEVKEDTVYVTRTGKKYHREGCVHLRQSKISISRKKAKESGYTPCKHCMPDN